MVSFASLNTPAQPDFIVYDTETTGLDVRHDQIHQFSMIKASGTDFSVKEEYTVNIRRLPYVVPDPEALMISNVNPYSLDDENRLTEYDAMLEINKKMKNGGKNAVFLTWNGFSFDEEILRTSFWRNLLPEIYVTVSGGNKRIDVMKVYQFASRVYPETYPVPMVNGKPSFKLTDVCAANGIDISNAHDASADCLMTLKIAQKIKENSLRLWEHMEFLSDSKNVEKIAFGGSFPYFFSFNSHAENKVKPLTYIINDVEVKRTAACFDLSFNPEDYIDMETEEISKLLYSKEDSPFKIIKTNKSPIVFSKVLPNTLAPDVDITKEEVLRRADFIRSNETFIDKVSQALRIENYRYTQENLSKGTSEVLIYNGFPNNEALFRLRKLTQEPLWEKKILYGPFHDKRINEMSIRLAYLFCPEASPYKGIPEAFKRPYKTGDQVFRTIEKANEILQGINDKDYVKLFSEYLDTLKEQNPEKSNDFNLFSF